MTFLSKPFKDSNKISIPEGLNLSESETPDMNVNYSAGIIRNGEDYHNTKTGSTIAVSAADAGKEKLAIIQKAYNANSAPAVKYGTAVNVQSNLNVVLDDDDSSEQFQDGPRGNWYYNGTGADITLTSISFKMDGSNATNVTITPKYLVSASAISNGSGSPDPATFTAVGAGQTWTTPFTARKTWSGLSITVPNGYYLHLIYTATKTGGTYYVCERGLQANSTYPTGITSAALKYLSSTWSVVTSTYVVYGGNDNNDVIFQTTYVAPTMPTADANNIKIGEVGSSETPITETTSAIVEGTPGANQVKLTPTNTYRI